MNSVAFHKALENRLNRSVDKNLVIDYLSKIRLNPSVSVKLASKYHLEKLARELSKASEEPIDIKAYQIKSIGKNSEDTIEDIRKHEGSNYSEDTEIAEIEAAFLVGALGVYDLSKAVAPKSKWKYNYIMFDSANCAEISDARNRFTWLIQEKTPVYRSGYINLPSIMRNIVAARMGRVTFAHQNSNFINRVRAKHRFGFGFEEFTSQAFITPYGNRFQFVAFLPDYDTTYGTTVTLSPFDANRGWFRFSERYKTLDKLTLSITDLNTSTRFVLPAEATVIPAIQLRAIASSKAGVIESPIDIPNYLLPVNPKILTNNTYPYLTSVAEEYIFDGIDTGEPAIDNVYNGSTHSLVWVDDNYFLFADGYTVPFDLYGITRITFPITVTLRYAPRFTGVLELISEDDSDDVSAL